MSIEELTNDDVTFAFQELLSSSTSLQDRALCELFTYGDYRMLKKSTNEQEVALRECLSEKQLFKLKQLTLLNIAGEGNHELKLDDLAAALDIEDAQELIIRSVFAGILKAKINSERNVVIVNKAAGRDLRLSELEDHRKTLVEFIDKTKKLLAKIDDGVKIGDDWKTATFIINDSA